MDRKQALDVLRTLPADVLEAFAIVAETADVQGDYYHDEESGGSVWEDSANATLSFLANEVRRLKGGGTRGE
jgi:hypothetical protein